MIALLQMSVLDGAAQIDRVAVSLLELIEMRRAIVHCRDNRSGHRARRAGDPSHRIGDGRRAEKRKHQIRARRRMVVAQGKAEIVTMLLQPEPFGRRIEESQQTHRGVDAEASATARTANARRNFLSQCRFISSSLSVFKFLDAKCSNFRISA